MSFSRTSNTWGQAQLGSSRGASSGMTFYLGGRSPTALLHAAQGVSAGWGSCAGAFPQPYSFAFPFPFPSHQSFKFCCLWNMFPSGCCTKYIATVPMRGESSHQLCLLLPQWEYFEKPLCLADACGSWALNSSHVCQFFTDLGIF